MFNQNKCKRCGKKIKDNWNFCPNCGNNLREQGPKRPTPQPLIMQGSVNMKDVFKDMNKILKSMMGEEPFKGGISITSLKGPNGPKVDVKTSGDYKKVEPQLKKKLGVKKKGKKRKRKPKATEEPEINVKEMPHENLIKVEVPGVKREEDVELNKLEQSLEIRAHAKDKTYFKLVPIPQNSSISEKELKEGVLKIRLKK